MEAKFKFLILFHLIFSLYACNTTSNESSISRPNILFIMSDDHAYQAVSCYDGSLNQTPNIDRLAEEGVRFQNSFCTNSICSPSRAVLLTGTYNHINGQIDNYTTFDGSQLTFPKLLQKAGYQTAMVGKWHLKSDPTGFDYWNILPGQGNYYNPDFIENGTRKQIKGYVTDLTTDIAINWLTSRDPEKPFCLLLHHKAPHRNWMPKLDKANLYDDTIFPIPMTFFDNYKTRGEAAHTQEMEIRNDFMMAYDLKIPEIYSADGNKKGKVDIRNWKMIYNRMDENQRKIWDSAYREKNRKMLEANLEGEDLAKWKYQRYLQDYLSCIATVDDNVGRVMDYLEKEGLADNTIVVYTSDQGFYLGEHGWFDKRFMYEQSLRMPLIVRYPNEISPGVDTENMVMNLDFAPTLLDYAGVDIPETMQGESMKMILSGTNNESLRDAIYYRYYEYPGVHSVKRHYGIRTPRYKLIHFYYDADYWELYDLANDPQEVDNLYNDVDYKDLVDTLKSELYKLQVKYADTKTDKFLPKPNKHIDHIAKGHNVIHSNSFSDKYTGGNKNALTDGVIYGGSASGNESYEVWQGFEGADMEAIIDLKEVSNISTISVGFLQKVNAWIFLPKEIEISISLDGKKYTEIGKFENYGTQKNSPPSRKEYAATIDSVEARFIKVSAYTIGDCPDWHVGKGEKSWIFADEIIVN